MMRAMILAAGRGQRMGELTNQTPKPLLRVAGKYLIEYAITNLARAGVSDIVINVSYQAEQVKAALGDGQRYGVNILYSEEPERLETGGGILQALPLLGDKPFIVVSSDIISDYPLMQLPRQLQGLAHLVMVDNPDFHPQGDFGLQQGVISRQVSPYYTFANMGVYDPALFADCQPGYFPLSHVLFPAIDKGLITGEHYAGGWHNVGTPKDLMLVEETFK